MSDPIRWRDARGEGPSGAADLLAHARRSPALPARVRDRSALAVAKLASGATAAAGTTATVTSLSLATKILSTIVLGGALGAGAGLIAGPPASRVARDASMSHARATVGAPVASRPSAAMPQPTAPTPAHDRAERGSSAPQRTASSAVHVATPARGASTPRPATPPGRRGAAPARSNAAVEQQGLAATGAAATAVSADALAAESALLERARGLLATDPAAALARTSDHATEFARGQLLAERELIAIDALTRLGRHDEARARADVLLARSPSLYRERVERILGDAAR